ncbi:MAG: hypothetical protein ACR2PK_14555, partial [Acidimicrobiales bacterium]
MTSLDPVTERLMAANPVPDVSSFVPTTADATEFLAIVSELDVPDESVATESGICTQCGSDLRVIDLQGPAESALPPASPKRRAVVAAAVAAAVVLMVGVVVVDGGDEVATNTVGSPEVTDPATTVESPQGPVETTVFGGAGAQTMSSVIAGGPGLVAVGHDRTNAAVWTSADGLTWSRILHDETAFANAAMISVTKGGPGLVAVGVARGGAAVWTSAQGVAWSRVPHDDVTFGGSVMTSVSTGGPGLVAVGWAGSDDNSDAAVWTSVDGMTWSRVREESVFGGTGSQVINGVTSGGPGLVAVGRDWDTGVLIAGVPEPRDEDAAVWTSVDGLEWSRVPHDGAVFGGTGGEAMSDVIASGSGVVAVGGDSSRGIVWTSVDGLEWSRVPHDEAVLGNAPYQKGIGAVTVGGPGLVAVDAAATVRTSVDGTTWSRTPRDEAVFAWPWQMNSVTAGGPGLVA